MEDRSVEQSELRTKKRLKQVIVLFIAALIGCTIYSNTLLTMDLPKVWAAEGTSGKLVQSYSGSGVLQPLNVVELTNKEGWDVEEVKIKVGDRVTKGQSLLTYNTRDAEERIQDDEANLSRLQLGMEGLQEQYIEAQQTADSKVIRESKRNLEIAQLEIGVQERKLRNMRDHLKNYKQITAPFDGIITEVYAVNGLPSGQAGSDVSLLQAGLGYQFTLDIPTSITDQLDLGQTIIVDIKIKGRAESQDGHIKEIENMQSDKIEENSTTKLKNFKRVHIGVQNNQLKGGELASVNLSMSSEDDETMLLPIKAIHSEGRNNFIYVIEEKTGPLGNTYVARKVAIEVGDKNDVEAAVLSGVYAGQSIIMESSEPLQDGSRVRLR